MTTPQQKSMSSGERRRWSVVLLVLLPTMLCVSSSTAQTTQHHTPEEEEEMDARIRDEMKAKDDRMRERAMQRRLEEQREAENRRAQREADKYKVDPVLAEIMRERLSDTRDRDRVERNLLEYIENNPDSVFMAELYFHLGAVYSHNALFPKEKLDRKKATMYFEKAHELFEGKYCVASDCAWAYLVLRRDVPVAAKREYYDWVRETKKLTPEDIWPYRNIEKCMIYGKWPELSQAERAKEAEDWHQCSGVVVTACERTLMMYADLPTLGVYAAEYPETELGRQAQMRLQKRADAIDHVLMEDLVASLAASLPTVATNETPQSDTARYEPSSIDAPKQDGDGIHHNHSTTTTWYLYASIVVAVLLISGLFVFGLRRLKRVSAASNHMTWD